MRKEEWKEAMRREERGGKHRCRMDEKGGQDKRGEERMKRGACSFDKEEVVWSALPCLLTRWTL